MEKSQNFKAEEEMRITAYNIVDTTSRDNKERKMWLVVHDALCKLARYYEKKEIIPCWKH